ncbi:HET domain-containing protein [Fusarium sp. Ph1]|nr:HET domain-containing protein [Fusarium sp. Ph1]
MRLLHTTRIEVELVAPRALDFYSQEWIYLGSRDAAAKTLELATGIPARVLFGQGLSGISVHHRMQWVATRSTTRPEDIAYCLLGIFDVNMPLLYGEGKKKAFQRLQEEIVKTSTDLSIFLWTVPRNEQDGPDLEFRGPLAEDPSWFTASGFQPKNDSRIVPLQDIAMSITNKGISVQWIILSVRGDTAKTLYVAMLAGAGEIKGGIVI